MTPQSQTKPGQTPGAQHPSGQPGAQQPSGQPQEQQHPAGQDTGLAGIEKALNRIADGLEKLAESAAKPQEDES